MESKKIELPSGNWVVFRDPSTLKVKDRKKIFKSADGQEGIMQAMSLMDGMIAVMVESWSFEFPIPSIKISFLDELSMADYDLLNAEIQKLQSVLFPQVTETEISKADNESPFDKSNA
jgi:hypothetical protein